MPFDEDEVKPSKQSEKIGLKGKVSGQKSVFDGQPKKPSPAEFSEQVKEVSQRASTYKQKASELAVQFNRAMVDKTLTSNRNVFGVDAEQELLLNMVRLAQEVNADPNEREGEGSLSWIILLLKTCFTQRDRINQLEYTVSQIDKKYAALSKEIATLGAKVDTKKDSE
jgi:hypothetical protein